ncbi:hypothetical protein CO165_02445 [Candidatus Roizmanbacteria bacterium CG_4_9_14_3_um_filter_33_18]|uniref:Uncharacterized protein n=3 Tax=Candidatus Roizmaniibacteriota TaxID=1752723 RepID=A0A2M7EKY9_9BACT|nr:MAG: hypothetical protein COS52_02495 [Candidatus Roizmanbacteria bacterium CG03_land_8_20_14_0_80_39_12]PIV71223.1 MAG: hypothetical protein COW57_00720 [Candidatus Roizmanbacteria bacterium CG17_big_fil_post_rev_8_21_14_2_50_39_7]PJA55649.1 MAG: hypothetical protein CO165_02445 [Candidatus Roizmanbacteria bacterium CG_4_9_14_3_um_filter_33_18]
MEKDFTSLDVGKIQQKYSSKEIVTRSFDINTVFLALIVITLIVLSILLFILIQKKMQELALGSFFA